LDPALAIADPCPGEETGVPEIPPLTEPHQEVLASPHTATPPSPIRIILQGLLLIVGIGVGLWVLQKLAVVVFVLILAALFAYVLAPLVRLAESPVRLGGRRRRLSRGVATLLVYVLLAGSLSAGTALLLPSATAQVTDMFASAPAYAQSILTWERGWSRYYERLRMPLELRQAINQSVLAADEAVLSSARGLLLTLMGSLSDLPWLVLIPILAFFLLKDAKSFRQTIVIALPRRIQLRGHRLFEEMNATLAAYVRAQMLACLLIGAVCGIGFAVLGIPYPVLLGVLAGILEFIPLVGPLLLATIAVVVGALHAPVLAVWAVAFLGILRVVEDYVIYPRLIRRGISLHPLTVILAVLAGAELAGVVGMFLSVPVVAVGSVAFKHWLEWRGVAGAEETTM
jgi:predicted PurR-regulated permease PerM